jgi:hypothetical protein
MRSNLLIQHRVRRWSRHCIGDAFSSWPFHPTVAVVGEVNSWRYCFRSSRVSNRPVGSAIYNTATLILQEDLCALCNGS